MDTIELTTQTRETVRKGLDKKRSEGLVPAVLYGHGIESKNLWVKKIDLKRVVEKAGESALIALTVDTKAPVNVLIHEVQQNPTKGGYFHADFFQVRMDEKITAHVEIDFFGEAPAEKELGGVLVKAMDTIEVECLPGDLPEHLKLDLGVLHTYDDHITIADVSFGPKVKILAEEQSVIASVVPPRKEEEEEVAPAEAEAEAVAAVETEQEGETEGEAKSDEKK